MDLWWRATHRIIVNLNNPVKELTLQQISDIYSGIQQLTEVVEKTGPSCGFRGRRTPARTLLPGAGAAPGRVRQQDPVFPGHPAAAFIGGITTEVRDNPMLSVMTDWASHAGS